MGKGIFFLLKQPFKYHLNSYNNGEFNFIHERRSRWAAGKAEDEIKIFRTLKLKKQLITPTEYPAYYRLMAEWMDTNGNSLLFQTAK